MLKKIYHKLFKNPDKKIIGTQNEIRNEGVLTNCKFDIRGNNNIIEIGTGTSINNMTFFIRGNNHKITIGKKCRFKKGEFWMEDEGGLIHIEDQTTVEGAHFAVTEPGRSIKLGKDCMLSYGIELRTGDSHSVLDLASGNRINPAKDVILEDHVWVGAFAIILKGVTIGHNSIVGTNSVVTKSVPAHCIVSGTPGKVIKEGIDWDRKRI